MYIIIIFQHSVMLIMYGGSVMYNNDDCPLRVPLNGSLKSIVLYITPAIQRIALYLINIVFYRG